MRLYFSVVWKTAIEASLLLACLMVMIVFGISVSWVAETHPLFDENVDVSLFYVEPAQARAGKMITTHRNMRRTDACANRAGTWIVDKQHDDALMPIMQYTGAGRSNTKFVDTAVEFWLPPGIAKGKYAMRTYLSCQRNPLSEITQQLRDLPFEVIE